MGAGQTLTALGSYWKGRKPLTLVRAIVLGSLPPTDDAEPDLEIFEKLMAFDEGALARRAANISPTKIARRISLSAPWQYFSFTLKGGAGKDAEEIADAQFQLDADDYPGFVTIFELNQPCSDRPFPTRSLGKNWSASDGISAVVSLLSTP